MKNYCLQGVTSRIDTQLAIDTLNAALNTRGNVSGLMFRSDRGSQFTAKRFRQYLDLLNIVQSFSSKGHPYDSDVIECFFKYLKKAETDKRNYSALDELKQSLITLKKRLLHNQQFLPAAFLPPYFCKLLQYDTQAVSDR